MMSKKQMMAYIAAILGTLCESGGAPESTLYIAVGMDMESWGVIRSVLLTMNWVTISSAHWVELTPEGRATGEKCNQVLAEARRS